MKRAYTKALLALGVSLMLAACGGFSAKEKREVEKLMAEHLTQKYNAEFSVKIVDNLHYASFGNPFSGGISGLKAEAHAVGEEDKIFPVHYHKKTGEIDDGYSAIFMTDRAEIILSETLADALADDRFAYEISTFTKPYDLLPSNQFTLDSELSEYSETFNIDVYVNKVLHEEELSQASETIDSVQKELLSRGINNFYMTVAYLNQNEFEHIHHINAVLNKYSRDSAEIGDLFAYCRLLDDCKIAMAIVQNGELNDTPESLEQGLLQHREETAERYIDKLPALQEEIETRVLYNGHMHIDNAVKHGYQILDKFTVEQKMEHYGKSKLYTGYQTVDGMKKLRLYLTDSDGHFLIDRFFEPETLELAEVRNVGLHKPASYFTVLAVVADYRGTDGDHTTRSSVYLVYGGQARYSNELNEAINRQGLTSLKDIYKFVNDHQHEYGEWISFK
ncbi:RNA-binding protein [Paenibacillus senegalensis]|uniref:hypothetical protein n=1 Tax=Paenibacillus senegalensis TaxID=1465766 RepID=UPI0002893BF6|nr:hypothetical protein [Paenibacillus senegalensis]